MNTHTTQNSVAPVLPHNPNAERSILGAILLDQSSLTVAAGSVSASDFFLPQHRHIFERMIALAGGNIAIDPVTLVEDLTRTGNLESAGGPAYISQLTDGMPRVSNVEHYARIVKEKSALRKLAYQGDAIRESALSEAADPQLLIENARIAIGELASSAALSGEPAAWLDEFDTWEAFEESKPMSFSIEGFLQNHGATMIGGLSGHGKTLILLSITRALLAGKGAKLWDTFEVNENAVRVVYLIPECTLPPFKHRLKLFRIYEALGPNDGRLLVRTLSKGPTPSLADPKILFAAKGAHVILDTAARFGDGDENSANDNAKGLASDIFSLLGSGARSVIAAHHAPKSFAKENLMALENVLRGSGDVGAMLCTAWGVKQIDAARNVIHVESVKTRDFEPCKPFQIIGRPFIDERGDFEIHKRPFECGSLADEQGQANGGAPIAERERRAANLALLRTYLAEDPNQTSDELVERFKSDGVSVSASTVRKYKMRMSK
jgi:DnaB helicase-like protein/AAA domain-containing protein